MKSISEVDGLTSQEINLLDIVDIPDPSGQDDLFVERCARLYCNLRASFLKQAITFELAKRELKKRRDKEGGEILAPAAYRIPPGQIKIARLHACRSWLYSRELADRVVQDLKDVKLL